MRSINILALSLVLLLGIAVSWGYAGTQKYGEAISNRQVTPIKDILANYQAYEGKLVTIEGSIASECASGCWFYVKVSDAGAFTIYVDIGKSGFAIPQKVGKKILVEGNVLLKETGPMIQGRGVEIR